MATPRRNTVDYFPHIISNGKKMDFIEKRHGNDGYATWFKILEYLASTDNHFLNLNDSIEVAFLSAKCNVDEIKLFDIIEDLVRLEVFHKLLWEHKIIWSEFFINSIQDAYKRRAVKPFDFDSLCRHLVRNNIVNADILHTLCIHIDNNNPTKGNRNEVIVSNSPQIVDNCPQSKVKYSKVEESKREREKEAITPTQNFSSYGKQPIETLKKNCAGYSEWLTVICKKNSLTMDRVLEWLDSFELHLLGKGTNEETESEFKRYFNSWITSEIRQGRTPQVKPPPEQKQKIDATSAMQNSLLKKYGHV